MHDIVIDRERAEGDQEYRNELRHRCQTDGFFLAPLLGFHDFIERIHRPVADLYVQKKPGLPITEQDTVKNRMHLDPRHTFKTSYGVVDTVQWVLTCPDITIVNETATQPLGKALTEKIARVFAQPKNKDRTLLQVLFPEYVVEKARSEYRAPCATRDEIEPTVYYTSVGSSQSGWHPWIINPDDMVDTENSGIDATDDSRDRVWNTYTTNLNTLREGGYVHVRGTRYHPFDAYGRMLEVMDPDNWKTLIRSSLIVNSGERLVEGEFPKEDEVSLVFPEILSYKKLHTKFREDYRTYMCQQQNDPQGGAVALFPIEKFRQMLMMGDRVPTTGEVRIIWRLQSDAKECMRHYAEGVALLYAGARVYVIDAWRGAYTPTELCERVVKGCKRNQCNDVTIENTPGSETLVPHIYNEATRQNWSIRIERPEFESDDAIRAGRMRNLQPMMKAGRLWISTWAGQQEALQREFTNYGLILDNGLIDTISRGALRIPASTFSGHVSAEQRAMHKAAKEAGWYDVVYGQGGAAEVEHAVATYQPTSPARNTYGLRPMLGGLDG